MDDKVRLVVSQKRKVLNSVSSKGQSKHLMGTEIKEGD